MGSEKMKGRFVKKAVSVLLAVSLLLSFSVFFYSYAAEQKGYVDGVGNVNLRVRTGPGTNHSRLVYNGVETYLRDGDEVTVIETVPSSNNDKDNPYWVKIRFTFNKATLEGYVSASYIKLYDDSNVEMPDGVPKEYESYIKALLAKHPNWNFVFYDTKLNWNELFSEKAQGYPGRSLIPKSWAISYRSTQSGSYNWRTDTWTEHDAGWVQANAQTIAYYMDPRNFLNENNVFMFEKLSYDKSNHNISGVQAILKNTFMNNASIKNTNGANVSYAQAFIDAANYANVSPYHLASRVVQEVGVNGSGSTSGKYPGYEGYYNFYNIGATQGSNPIANGLNYAKTGGDSKPENKAKWLIPWDSQYKSIKGGAKWIATGYIEVGQDTLYFQKYNTVNPDQMWHQYMGNVAAPKSESVNIRKSYNEIGILDSNFTFIIPYYRNMPSSAAQLPAESNKNPNNWLKSLTVSNCSFSFDGGTTSYNITVPSTVSSVEIKATSVNSKATISGTGNISLKTGENTVDINVTAENGDKRTYTLKILRSQSPNVPMTGITLSKSSLTLFKGDSTALTVSYQPSNTTDNRTVTWSSSNSSVATVSNGKVTAVSKGTATITAKVGSFTQTCKVTVNTDYVLGDVDADGAVTISDALMIFKYKSGAVSLSSIALSAADTDRNGKVELNDALRIFKYKSGEIGSL